MTASTAEYTRYWLGTYTDLMDHADETVRNFAYAKFHAGVQQMASVVANTPVTVKWTGAACSYLPPSGSGPHVIELPYFWDITHADAVVGIALHEASHVNYSKTYFNVLKLVREGSYANQSEWVDYRLKRRFDKYNIPYLSTIRFLLNILEDFRIDEIHYKKFSGYRGYYRELYRYFYYTQNTLSRLNNDDLTVTNYMFQLLFCRHADFDVTVLPAMRKILKIVDIPNLQRYTIEADNWEWPTHGNVHYDKSYKPAMLKDAEAILHIVLDHIEANGEKPSFNPKSGYAEQELGQIIRATIDDDYPGSDIDEVRHTVSLIKDDITGTISDRDKAIIDQLNEITVSDMQYVPYPDGDPFQIDAFVIKNYHQRTQNKPFLDKTCNVGKRRAAVHNGLNDGRTLAKRLKILGEESPLKFNRKMSGTLDKHRLAALGYEDQLVFEQTHIVKHDPIFLDVSIDASGSMLYNWDRTLWLLTVLASASKWAPKLDTRITLRSTNNAGNTQLGIIFDSRVNTIADIQAVFSILHPEGGTPEGLAFEAMLRTELGPIPGKRHFFLSIGDGMPGTWCTKSGRTYGGSQAIEHTRKVINKMKKFSKVLGYYIGNGEHFANFQTMYGHDAVLLNSNELGKIVTTLNRLFLEK